MEVTLDPLPRSPQSFSAAEESGRGEEAGIPPLPRRNLGLARGCQATPPSSAQSRWVLPSRFEGRPGGFYLGMGPQKLGHLSPARVTAAAPRRGEMPLTPGSPAITGSPVIHAGCGASLEVWIQVQYILKNLSPGLALSKPLLKKGLGSIAYLQEACPV